MSMKYIRDHYGVPARRGVEISFQGAKGVIVASQGCYLRVKFPDGIKTLHPTWNVEYPQVPPECSDKISKED